MVDAHGDYESKYTQHELLGEGGFGAVYLVTHKAENKKYVAKKMKIGPNPSDLSKKFKEVELLHKLKHPNIVPYKEFFIEKGFIILVMEYCECKFFTFLIF